MLSTDSPTRGFVILAYLLVITFTHKVENRWSMHKSEKKKYVVDKGMPEQTMKVHKTTKEFVFVFVRSICSVCACMCACMRACVACVREYVRVCVRRVYVHVFI